MATTTSFSKGCFVFKAKGDRPKNTKRSPKKKKRTAPAALTLDDEAAAPFTPIHPPSAVLRLQLYRDTWTAINNLSQDVISESHRQLLADIAGFLSDSVEASTASIPTAVVALGVNLPDHHTFFNLLDVTLEEHLTPYIARLDSKECPSLKHMVAKAVTRLVRAAEDAGDAAEDAEDAAADAKQKTLAQLALWYRRRQLQKPIVIVLQDLECFGAQQLQDFVLLCREYRSREQLPVLLVLGIATPMTLQQQLHHRTSVCLATRSFQSPPSVQLLNALVEKLVIATDPQRPFKIGPRLVQQLLDGFLYHDLSLNSFLHRVQLVVLQHFISLPVSVLCCAVDLLAERVEGLAAEELDLYRQLPSFMKLVENDRSRVQLLTDDVQFRRVLLASLQELAEHSSRLALHCRALHAFTLGLPDGLFGKTLRELYVHILSGSTARDDWPQLARLVGLSSAHELRARLQRTLDVMHDSQEPTAEELRRLLEEFRRLDSEEATEGEQGAGALRPLFAAQGKKMDKFELKAQLMATARQARPASRFDELRAEVVAWLTGAVAAALRPPSTLPFHEVGYAGSGATQADWDVVPWLRRQMAPVPRVAVNQALTDPASYLQCRCCQGQGRALAATMPDLCVAYKLHTECGKLINLYDWMVSFDAVLSKDPEEERDEIEPVMQARFIRCVAQLQLLGFVQSTKRKTDHVARLTWGV